MRILPKLQRIMNKYANSLTFSVTISCMMELIICSYQIINNFLAFSITCQPCLHNNKSTYYLITLVIDWYFVVFKLTFKRVLCPHWLQDDVSGTIVRLCVLDANCLKHFSVPGHAGMSRMMLPVLTLAYRHRIWRSPASMKTQFYGTVRNTSPQHQYNSLITHWNKQSI